MTPNSQTLQNDKELYQVRFPRMRTFFLWKKWNIFLKVQSQQRSYFRWLSIRHKTITLHRHQKDFLDKLVVKKNSLKETFKQRKLLRTRFGKKHIREEFLPWKSKLCSCVSSFFSWQVWFVQNWNVRGFLRWTETSFFLNFIYTT